MKQDKLIELCAKCAGEYAKGLESTNMVMEPKASGMIQCWECGRKCWGSSYRIRRRQDDGRGAEETL